MGSKPVCVVVGVGPGNGTAFAKRFDAEGYAVALLARGVEYGEGLARELSDARAYACDVTDSTAVAAVFQQIAAALGPPSVLVYNAGSGRWGTIDELSPADFESTYRVNVVGAVAAVQAVLPGMRRAGTGNVVFIGATASLRGKPKTSAFAAAKAGQRSLAQSLARQLGPEGIHVSLVILDGWVTASAPPDTPHIDPADVAETIVHLVRQPRTGWTFELDLRDAKEPW